MDNDQILALIKEALADVAPNRKADFANIAFDNKIEALGLDSIATMEMVNFVEEKVDATFPDEELAKVQTVRDLAGLIRDGRVSAG
jgi:acyl carrier protein